VSQHFTPHQQPGNGYAADITPREAVELVSKGAVLVDVRTVEEWRAVGVPDLTDAGTAPLFIEWNRSDGTRNVSFLNQLNALKGRELLFLCRSGVRSVAAAQSATAAGHTAYNVLHGFEAAGGWRSSGLATTAHAETTAHTETPARVETVPAQSADGQDNAGE
jgi:rhodanese-related sulfurtransferase